MNIEFTPEAISDLKSIRRYIAKANTSIADNVVSRIRQTILMFERFPLLGRSGRITGTREFAIPGLPYTVVYRIQNETIIQILTVIHQRMKYPPEE